MAPRQSVAGRRNQSSQGDNIYELGVQGRKTGVVLPDTGRRDSKGFEPLDDIFSSPEKRSPVRAVANGNRAATTPERDMEEEESDDSSGQDMDIENTTAPDPARLMNGLPSSQRNGIKMPLPRGRSPIKTHLQSPAHKNPHLPSSSPMRGSIVEHASRDSFDRSQSAKRRLDFSMSTDGHALPKPGRHDSALRSSQQRGRGTNARQEEEDDEALLEGHGETDLPDESMAMVGAGRGEDDDDDIPYGNEVDDWGQQDEQDLSLDEDPQIDGSEEEQELAEEEQEEDPEEELPRLSSPAPKRKRGRPPGKRSPAQQEEVEADEAPQRASKRRRSNNNAKSPAPAPPSPAPEPKKAGRPRGRPSLSKQTAIPEPEEPKLPKAKRGRPPKTAAAPAIATSSASALAAKPANAKVSKARRQRSPTPAADADTSLAVVPRGPPLPKGRGLLINRRVQVPGEDGILRTRSGRNSYRPLAFWRNEHVDYDPDATVEDKVSRRQGKLLLPTVKGVIRVEEEDAPTTKRRQTYKSSSFRSKSKRKSEDNDEDSRHPFFDPIPAEPWESGPGTVLTNTIVWRPEYDWDPPGLDEEVEVAPEQVAVSGRAIETREIRNASFKFAKTLSLPFFGAGVVDLPPGSEKRPKNSRKMYMAFFVYTGKVKVTVNEASFRIGRGGQWFVPRGNTYSIENDYDQPARVFFSQGCEPVQRPEDLEDEEGAQASQA